MSVEIDAREVLKYLNELGYCDITTRQLKEFIRDLKTLIKYEYKKKPHIENQENIHPIPSESCYCSVQAVVQSDSSDYVFDTEDVATQTQKEENYLSEIFSTLHCNSTVSSRAKSCSKKPSDQNIISVNILKPKPSRTLPSSCTTSGINKNEVNEKLTSSSLAKTKYTCTSSDTVSEPTIFIASSRSGRRTKSADITHESRPKVSFIRPRKPVKVSKSDPVALYQQYQEGWKKHKMPGEDKRYDLRWAIRERMLGDPDVLPRTSMDKISKKSSRI